MQPDTHVSDMTGPQAEEHPDGVELCLELHLASMFPKKHMPGQIIQRGTSTVEEEGDLVLNISNTWLPFPLPLPSCSADQRGRT